MITNNNILIGAEGLDGANFLASCLTMSDEVYFNNYTLIDKIEYFFKGMSEIEEKNGVPIWSDVSMLFSSCAREKNKVSFSIYQSKSLYESLEPNLNNKSLISKVRLPVFWPLKVLVLKNPQDPIVKLFESKYFIGLVNPDLFISLRSVLGYSELNNHQDYNLDLLTISEFNFLPKETQETIKHNCRSNFKRLFDSDIFDHHKWNMSNLECDLDYIKVIESHINNNKDGNLYKEDNQLLENKITHQWNCNWFLTEGDTIENIKILYSEFNLGKCNEKLICKMYKVWYDRMEYIKKWYMREFKSSIINNHKFIT